MLTFITFLFSYKGLFVFLTFQVQTSQLHCWSLNFSLVARAFSTFYLFLYTLLSISLLLTHKLKAKNVSQQSNDPFLNSLLDMSQQSSSANPSTPSSQNSISSSQQPYFLPYGTQYNMPTMMSEPSKKIVLA